MKELEDINKTLWEVVKFVGLASVTLLLIAFFWGMLLGIIGGV